jgi:2-keto-4-pentenoate hydratase/2-oxohepta-3-ene-1,7-dioic acid hydratase in catechol pathway
MIWGRIKTIEGRILSGEIRGGMLTPSATLGGAACGEPVAVDSATLMAPSMPGKFIGLWNNYHAAAVKNGTTIPDHPLWFMKPTSSVVGQGAEIALTPAAGRVIFEGELGIVIGKTCNNVSEAEAEAAIFGYTCINDVTSLDVLNADPAFAQWSRAKGFAGFGAIGPVIATGIDWRDLTIRTLVNDRERQCYQASDMIFSPPEIVRLLSRDMSLEAGDVIAVGTSLGVRPVKAGDRVSVSIEGIGALDVTFTAG